MATTAAVAASPIVLTLALDSQSQLFFNALRQRHFPKERSFLAAHVTLFHHLPGDDYDAIRSQVATAAGAEAAPLQISVTGVRFLGRGGVAYTMENQRLRALHKRLQKQWHGKLTLQDQQRLNPHITVQNKVDADIARALHQELSHQFQPFDVTGTGLQLWAYRGGPWEALDMFPFAKDAHTPQS